MKNIVLIGGGGHCKSVIDVIELDGRFSIAGIIDKPERLGQEILGYSVIGCDSDMNNLAKLYCHAIITVGQIKSASLRVSLFKKAVKSGFVIPSIVSPKAYVSKHAQIGKGVVVMHNALVNSGAVIEDNCIINSQSLVEHDCKVSKHCHISTNVTINGGSIIGRESFIGSGTITKELAQIAERSFVKAGSLVI